MSGAATTPEWSLTLYVSGASSRSSGAIDTIREICDTDLAGQVHLQIIDVGEQPALAVSAGILAVPTLVKHRPPPVRHRVGGLSDAHLVRIAIDIEPAPSGPTAALPDEGH